MATGWTRDTALLISLRLARNYSIVFLLFRTMWLAVVECEASGARPLCCWAAVLLSFPGVALNRRGNRSTSQGGTSAVQMQGEGTRTLVANDMYLLFQAHQSVSSNCLSGVRTELWQQQSCNRLDQDRKINPMLSLNNPLGSPPRVIVCSSYVSRFSLTCRITHQSARYNYLCTSFSQLGRARWLVDAGRWWGGMDDLVALLWGLLAHPSPDPSLSGPSPKQHRKQPTINFAWGLIILVGNYLPCDLVMLGRHLFVLLGQDKVE